MNAHVVSCVVGGEQYAVRDADVRVIARVERVQRALGPDGRIGTIAVGGQTVPVHALAAVFGRGAEGPPTGHHVIVTDGARGMVGWLVDRVVRARLSDDTTLRPLPALLGPVARAWFDGLLTLQDRLVLLLSPDRLDRGGSPPRAVAADPPPVQFAHGGLDITAATGSPAVVIFSTPAFPRCGADRYALSARQVAGVVPSLPVIRVPGSASHVAGLIAWRAEVIPVVDFRTEVERLAAAGRELRFLMARGGARLQAQTIAFPVHALVTLHRPTPDDREQAGDGPTPPFVAGFFDVAGDRVALLDLDGLLGSS